MVEMVRVMYPFIALVSLSALVMGMLNARDVFRDASAGFVLF